MDNAPLKQFRTALYRAFKAPLEGLGVPLFPFEAPEGQLYPYAVVGRIGAALRRVKTAGSWQMGGSILVYGKKPDADTVADALNMVLQIANRTPLQLDDGFEEITGLGGPSELEIVPRWDDRQVVLEGSLAYEWEINPP